METGITADIFGTVIQARKQRRDILQVFKEKKKKKKKGLLTVTLPYKNIRQRNSQLNKNLENPHQQTYYTINVNGNSSVRQNMKPDLHLGLRKIE